MVAVETSRFQAAGQALQTESEPILRIVSVV